MFWITGKYRCSGCGAMWEATSLAPAAIPATDPCPMAADRKILRLPPCGGIGHLRRFHDPRTGPIWIPVAGHGAPA